MRILYDCILYIDDVDLPELLPFGYLVGDVTSIVVSLKGKYPLSTLCLEKVSSFKLSVTLSKRNRFSKFLHC